MAPRVTIGICAKNAEKTISAAIESAISQDYPHHLLELILVDDGSEDKTLKLMQQYASNTDIAVRIFSSTWKGIGKARNTVVNNAKGEYIVWLDSDQTIEKEFVKKQVSLMEKNPQAGIAIAQLELREKRNTVLLLELLPAVVEHSCQDWTKPSKLPGTCGATYRVMPVKAVGGFDEKIRGLGEDIDMARRIRQAGWTIITGKAMFYEMHRSISTWGDLWRRYVNRGFHSRYLYEKNPRFFSLYRMNPISSFFIAVMYAIRGYRKTKLKIALLLPFHFSFKMFAWFYGFSKH